MTSSEKLAARESPVREFAERNALTERRTAILLLIQEELHKHEFMFRTLMKLDPNVLRKAQGHKPVHGENIPTAPVRVGSMGLLAHPGVFWSEWLYSAEEALILPDFTRFLIVSGSSEIPFYLHATLDKSGEVIWYWRDIQGMRQEIYRASLLVLRWSVHNFIHEELPAIHDRIMRYEQAIETWRWVDHGDLKLYDLLPATRRFFFEESATA